MAPPTKKGGNAGGDDRVSGRPTLVPSVGPEVHAQRTLRDAERRRDVPDLDWPQEKNRGSKKDRRSQVPTIQPPSLPDTLNIPSTLGIPRSLSITPKPGESQRPTATDFSGALELGEALDFVDGHQRESIQPGTVDPASLHPQPEAAPDSSISISDLFAVGDFTGALSEAERRLAINAEDDEALRYLDECRRTLIRMYSARLAPLDRVVRLAVAPGEIRWLTLDHRAGFLISRMDGTCSVEDLLDVSGMPRLDALKILHELVNRGVVVVG